MSALVAQLKFTFSSTRKHNTVKLGEQNTRATRTSNEEWAVVMLEPVLPMSTPSNIKFKINKTGYFCMGVCSRNVVKKQSFFIKDSARTPFGYSVCGDTGHSTYLLKSDGYLLTL